MGKRASVRHWSDGDGDRPRVLLECPPEESPAIVASLLERHGYEVRTCDGPRATTCELLDHGVCPLVDGADAVVNLLGSEPDDRTVLDAVARIRRPPAVVAQARRPASPDAGDPDALLAAVVWIRERPSRTSLVRAIETALDRRPIERP